MGMFLPIFDGSLAAVLRCGRAGFGLPLDKCDQWKDHELALDATDAEQG